MNNTVEQAICFRNQLETFSLPKTLDGQDAFKQWPDKKGEYHQQGDALFFPSELKAVPKDAKLRLDKVAVEGLKRHTAVGKGVKVYEGWIYAPNGCTIKHGGGEHGDTVLSAKEAKVWQVKQVLEFDHILEESRKVID